MRSSVKRVTQRRAVVVGVAPDFGPAGVQVGVHVHHRQRPVAGGHGAHGRKRHGVVSPHDEGGSASLHHLRHLTLDDGTHQRRVEGRQGDIPAVQRREFPEDVHLVGGVVGLHQGAHPADGVGRKPGAGLVGGAAVVGDAQQHRAGAGVGRGGMQVRHGKPEEGRLAVAEVLGCRLLAQAAFLPRSASTWARAASAQASAVAKSRGCKGRPKCTVASTTPPRCQCRR